MTDERRSIEARNRSIVEHAFAAWADGSGSVFDILADDVSWTIEGSGPTAQTYHGRQAYIDAAVTPLGDRIAGPVVPNVHHIWAVDDWVIVRWEQDTPTRDGQIYRNSYAWFFLMREGQVAKATAFLDLRMYDDLMARLAP